MERSMIVKAGVAYAAKIGGGTIASVSEINLLTEGALAFFTEEGALVPLAGPVPVVENVYAAIGMPTGTNPLITGRISRDKVEYELKTHVHAQAKIMVFGNDTAGAGGYGSLNLPATLAIGDTVGIWVYDLKKPMWDETRKKSYEVAATVGSTFNSILTALVAKINAHTAGKATAATILTVGGDVEGITLTAKTAGDNFEAISFGLIINADKMEAGLDNTTYLDGILNDVYLDATAWNATVGHANVARINIPWEGSDTQVRDIELVGTIDMGNRNFYRKGPEWKVPSVVVAGELYDVITMSYTNPDDRQITNGGEITQKLYICIPDADVVTLTTPLVANVIAAL